MKRKKSTPKKTAKGKAKRQRKSTKVDKRPSKLRIVDGISDKESDDSSEDEMDLKSDWIPYIGYQMPSTKLDAIKDLVDKWVKEDKKVKIVIFTQFLASVTLIEYLCQTKEWGYTKVRIWSIICQSSLTSISYIDVRKDVLFVARRSGQRFPR
jgi:ERCC4-related helicase